MITTEAVAQYMREVHAPNDPVLAQMYVHARRDGIPVVVPGTGALLEVIAAATAAERAVEVGTAIGVSTLRLARGGCHVISFEIDEERHRHAQKYLEKAGLSESVDLRFVDATAGLTQLKGPFDLAFIDGPKSLYSGHIDLVLPLLRPGGTLIIDNTLMSGSVAEERPVGHWKEADFSEMRELNRRLVESKGMLGVVTPVGDGVTIAVTRS
jgi:predicted O-methyltransferase YrrM